ncbi:hypothetical protein GCM10009530_60420 [Microbispora corallina]|uniref:Glycosyltransferase RgtA/B/C/D-like domain-containing protein n=1 Tax=Microbispora corallina TaxID=83302 RepID=A0ABQ4FZ08_9ACTN|nr:hypothetical protein Mco01_30280 [Microbispora corallina]
MRLLAGADRRLWLVVGLAAGTGLENKDTLLFLAAGLAMGLVLTRRWDVVRSPWPWAATGIALLLWAPNLAWQATNGWPQLTMASRIAGYAADNRAQIVPLLWLFTGPLLFVVSAAGVAWVFRSRDAARWRAIGVAGLLALALAAVTGGKAYYAIGGVAVFMAAGSIVVDRWLARGHARLKGAGFAVAAAMSGVLIGYLTLPVLPLTAYAASSLPTAAGICLHGRRGGGRPAGGRACPSGDPDYDYSEASALVLLGSGLPPVYSGHNAYWAWGPPPARRTVIVHVGDWRPADWSRFFIGCHDVARIDNGLGIQNGEQGKAVSVCTGLKAPWTSMWSGLRTIS